MPERDLVSLHQQSNEVLAVGCRQIAEAKCVEDLKEIRDRAQAFQYYARRQELGLQAMNDGAEIKLRADRRIGELLQETPKQRPGEYKRSHHGTVTPALADLGIDKKDSSRCQRVARVPDERFERHLAEVRASGAELTTAGVLRLAKTLERPGKHVPSVDAPCTVGDLDELVQLGCRFGTIYADPPWPYSNQATRASTDNHYQTMTLEDITALPVSALAAADAHLHLWTTNAFLPHAFDLVRAWGFEYRSVFVWCKPQMGIGNYWRVSHEFLVLGIRGTATHFLDRGLMSWAALDRGQHSGKPEQVRHMLERASPGPRLEMFGRLASEGWTVWGNEIERDLFYQGTNVGVGTDS